MFQSSVTDFNFGTETCDTSKYCKWWLVGRWMEPTESLVLCKPSIFQIICHYRSRQLLYFHFSFLQRSQLKKWSQNHSLHDSPTIICICQLMEIPSNKTGQNMPKHSSLLIIIATTTILNVHIFKT